MGKIPKISDKKNKRNHKIYIYIAQIKIVCISQKNIEMYFRVSSLAKHNRKKIQS